MNFLSLLDRISSVDAPSAAAPRRDLLRHLGQAGARAAGAALPVALAAPAQAAPTNNSFDAIVLLLKLEDLLVDLYTKALAAPVLTSAAQAAVRPGFVLLLAQQQGHARFLRDTLSFAGLTPPAAPGFDFSGRRNNPANPVLFPDVLSDYAAFLQLAQQLEDASASIYLGQLAFLAPEKPLFDAVLRMQLVEARHAAHLRTLRRTATPATAVKSWPSTADPAPAAAVLVPGPGNSATAVSIYAFEANERQVSAGTTVVPFPTILTGLNAVQARSFAEAFDEPLPTRQATALLTIFG